MVQGASPRGEPGPRARETPWGALTWLRPLAHGVAELAAAVPLPGAQQLPGLHAVHRPRLQVRDGEVDPVLHDSLLRKRSASSTKRSHLEQPQKNSSLPSSLNGHRRPASPRHPRGTFSTTQYDHLRELKTPMSKRNTVTLKTLGCILPRTCRPGAIAIAWPLPRGGGWGQGLSPQLWREGIPDTLWPGASRLVSGADRHQTGSVEDNVAPAPAGHARPRQRGPDMESPALCCPAFLTGQCPCRRRLGARAGPLRVCPTPPGEGPGAAHAALDARTRAGHTTLAHRPVRASHPVPSPRLTPAREAAVGTRPECLPRRLSLGTQPQQGCSEE